MVRFIIIDKKTGNVIGHQMSGKATKPPPDDASRKYVVIDDAGLKDLIAKETELRNDSRADAVRWNGIGLEVPPDRRPRMVARANVQDFDVESGAQVVGLDAETTIRIEAADASGVPLNGRKAVTFEGPAGQPHVVAMDFQNGVAERSVKFPASGRYSLRSSPKARIETPVEILALA